MNHPYAILISEEEGQISLRGYAGFERNVEKALSSIPEEQRAVAKEMVYKQVEKQVDEEINHKGKIVKTYGVEVGDYALKTISSSFADLYKASIPFVLICCLIGFIFRDKKRKDTVSSVQLKISE